MKALKIQADGSLRPPPEILQCFPKASELAVWTEGDMIVWQRRKPLKPSQFAEQEPEEEMPLEEIAAEVHRMRRKKQDIAAEAEIDAAFKAARGKGRFHKVFR